MRFLFVDRILAFSPGKETYGLKHVTFDDYYLSQSEQGQLHFMSSFIGETLGQLAAWNVMKTTDFSLRPVAGIVSSARLLRPVCVGETLHLESHIETLDDKAVQYHSVAKVNNDVVFRIEGALGPLLPMSDFIDLHEVRTQFEAINRPGKQREALPDTKYAALTSPYARLPTMQFDRILAAEPGVSLLAEKCISHSASYFKDHFPKKPVLPLTVLLECKQNLANVFLEYAAFAKDYRMSELRKIKMSEFVYPGDILTCHVNVKSHDEHQLILSFKSEVEGKRVCVLDLIMLAKNK